MSLSKVTGRKETAAHAPTPKTLAAYNGIIWDSAVALLIQLSEATRCPVIILHTNTRRSVQMIREAKARGVPISAEVNHWTFFLAKWDYLDELGPYMLSYCIADDNLDAVWEGANDGTLDMMASDHAPHTREEKRNWLGKTCGQRIQARPVFNTKCRCC